MKRRQFIAGLGCAAVWPVDALPQQRAIPIIGWLYTVSPEAQSSISRQRRHSVSTFRSSCTSWSTR